MNELAIIIVSYNTQALTIKCLSSIKDSLKSEKAQIWLVDNGSVDDTVQMVKKSYPEVNVIESKKNLGFSAGNNLALKEAKSDYYLFLNSDTVVLPGSIESLLEVARSSDYSIISPKLLNLDRSLQPNSGDLPSLLAVFMWLSNLDAIFNNLGVNVSSFHQTIKSYYQGTKEVGWVGGTAFLVKRGLIEKIGSWDDKIFMYGEDVEWCLRAKRSGFKVGWTDSSEIIHLGGGSQDDPHYRQWLGEFKGLIYIYKKYYGSLNSLGLRIIIYLFTAFRVVAFAIFGKFNYSKTYAKILINL